MRQQCIAITKKGHQCSRFVKDNRTYCWQHPTVNLNLSKFKTEMTSLSNLFQKAPNAHYAGCTTRNPHERCYEHERSLTFYNKSGIFYYARSRNLANDETRLISCLSRDKILNKKLVGGLDGSGYVYIIQLLYSL